MTDRILKIPFLPDLSMPKYRTRHGEQALHKGSMAISNLVSLLDHTSEDYAILRYKYLPNDAFPQERLRLFLRIHMGDTSHDAGDDIYGQHFLDEFYASCESSASEAFDGLDAETCSVFSVQRAEELFHEPENDMLYFSPLPLVKDSGIIADSIDTLMHSLQAPCLIDIIAKPYELDSEESQALLCQLRELDRYASAFDPEKRDSGLIEDLARQRDLLAMRHRDFYQGYFDSLYSGRIYEFGIRVCSLNKREGSLVARYVAETISPHGHACVMEHSDNSCLLRPCLTDFAYYQETFQLSSGQNSFSKRLSSAPSNLQEMLPDQFARSAQLSHLCCLWDAGSMNRLLQLPTSDGVCMRTIPIESEMRGVVASGEQNQQPQISLGVEAERPGEIKLSAEQMQKHLFVAGVTGSGKTTTILNLLTELWEKHRIPFLVLEPAKSEYRVLAEGKSDLARNLRIYSPGNERFSPFRFNPLEVPPGVTVEEHISSLESCFAGAIPMSGGPLPSLITEAIVACYEETGFRLCDSDIRDKPWPTMNTLVEAAGRIMGRRGYVGEVKANLQTAIDVRLKSLCQRSVGRMFSFNHSFPSVDELLRHPTILELDSLNLDQQNLLVLFLLASIRERLSRKGPSKSLRHIIVLEEAHNLIGVQNAQGRTSEDFADPRGHAARFVMRLLAEVRAFGEGIMVVDQSPAAIAPDVLKNTSIKVVHRTVSEDDRNALAAAMLMDKYAHEELARLEVGDAFVYHEQLYRPKLAKCHNMPTDLVRLDDIALVEKMAYSDWFGDGQEARLRHLTTQLEQLLILLRKGLVKSATQLPAKENSASRKKWQTDLKDLINQATSKLESIVSTAMLDSTIRPVVSKLHQEYLDRMGHLVCETSAKIKEESNDSQKQK